MNIKNVINTRNIIIMVLIILICGILFFYQTQKIGFHEDEGYSIASSVSPYGGLMTAYENNDLPENEPPAWKTKEYVRNYVTLTKDNYLNLKAVYRNQQMDNHPPVFYLLTHFSTMLFGGQYTKYSIFIVNIIAFFFSCLVIKRTLKLMNKEKTTIATLILYGLSMGTISMVLYQRMYMVLTLFILLYFYYNVKIYVNGLTLDKKTIISLSAVTILGFLTQYFFIFYAAIIFIIMLIKMIKDKKYDTLKKYIIMHVICAVLGILIFPPSINHLLFSDRGLKNLSNSNYFTNLGKYINYLSYAFTVDKIILLLFVALLIVFIRVTILHKKTEERFFVLLATIPSIVFLIATVQLTSFQELRYIMPMFPFIVLILYLILDTLIDVKYKEYVFIALSIVMVLNGFMVSTPKFLYKNYNEAMKIAEENKEKSFVYVYDNFFNHMQSLPEMMTYEKTLIINNSKNELEVLSQNEELNNENEFILCIKSYMNNEEILEKIKNNTQFKNIKTLYINPSPISDEYVGNNLYLVQK